MKRDIEEYIIENAGSRSIEEMSKETGLSENEIEAYLCRARQKAKKYFEIQRLCAFDADTDEKVPSPNKTHIIYILVIIGLTFIAYFNAIHCDFVWDDEFLILNNEYIRNFTHIKDIFRTYLSASSGNINNFYRPLQELSYLINYHFGKLEPSGYHFTNIILHAICALLVYIFSYRVLKNSLAAFIAGALFAVHPINTEAIAYVAGRADPLYLIFFLASCILFIKSTEPLSSGDRIKFMPYILAMISFLLSMLSKEIAVILPFILLLYVFTFYPHGGLKNRLYALCIPFGVLALLYAIARKTVLDFSGLTPSSTMGGVNILLRLLTTFKVIFVYVKLLILPYGLHMERDIDIARGLFEFQVLGALIFIILLYILVLRFYSLSRKLFFGGALFFVALLPVSNIVPINSFIAEHWLYLPAVGIYMIISMGILNVLSKVRERPLSRVWSALTVFAIFLMLAYYTLLTVERNKDWRDEISFFKSTLKYRQDNARLHLNFGNTYYEKEDLDNAIKEYIRAVEIRPDYAEGLANIGSILIRKHKYDEAERYIKRGLAIKPKMPFALYMIANINMSKGNHKEAEKYFLESLAIMPGFLDCRLRLGQMYAEQGEIDKALYQWGKAIEINPYDERAKKLIYKYSKQQRQGSN